MLPFQWECNCCLAKAFNGCWKSFFEEIFVKQRQDLRMILDGFNALIWTPCIIIFYQFIWINCRYCFVGLHPSKMTKLFNWHLFVFQKKMDLTL